MPNLATSLQRPISLKDASYCQIKELLLTGKLEHDHLYSAQHFAEMLGVSRTPVREALLQLAGEGLLICFDVRGFKIKAFREQEIRDVFDTRVLIETHVMSQVAESLPVEDLKQMEQTLKAMGRLARKGDGLGFMEADKAFHMVPLQRCGNQHLLSIMANIRDHVTILSLQALGHPRRFDEVIREHSAILQALRRHDAKKAVQALEHHLATTQRYWAGSARQPSEAR